MKRIFKVILVIVLLPVLLLYGLAPFQKSELDNKRSIAHTVQINVPVDSAFRYLGHSNSAAEWSVFVHHITTLNAAEFADGSVGCKRRCFCRQDETGRQWDETILNVVKDSLRTISIEHLVDFPMEAENLQTQQVYQRVSDSICAVTLRLYYVDNDYGYWDGFKTRLGAFTIKSIFKKNLENIKAVLEGDKRIHPLKEL